MGSSLSGYRKDEYGWRYDADEISDDVLRASSALESIHLDRKTRSLSSWRYSQAIVFPFALCSCWLEANSECVLAMA